MKTLLDKSWGTVTCTGKRHTNVCKDGKRYIWPCTCGQKPEVEYSDNVGARTFQKGNYTGD